MKRRLILPIYFWFRIFFIIIFVSINLTKINYLFYLPCIFIIAGRQGAMVQLVHEASHHLISKNHKLNDFFEVISVPIL